MIGKLRHFSTHMNTFHLTLVLADFHNRTYYTTCSNIAMSPSCLADIEQASRFTVYLITLQLSC